MRKRLPTIILAIIFLIGAGIFAYPTVSEQWNRLHQSRAIATYQEAVDDMTEEDYAAAWEAAEAYNAEIEENTFNHDAFSQEEENLRGTEYWSVLNIGGIYLHSERKHPAAHLPWYFRCGPSGGSRTYVRNEPSHWRRRNTLCDRRSQRIAQRQTVHGY